VYTIDALWQEFYRRMAAKAEAMVDPGTGMVQALYVHEVPCPYCASRESSMRVIVHGFNYVTCRSCGLVYINPQLTREALREVYNDEDVRTFFFRELLLPYSEALQRPDYEHRARQLKKLSNRACPRLLDIGCAAGNFLQIASEQGFEGEGLELNSNYVEYIRQHRALKVFDKRLEDVQYPADTFDVVTLWDVLEHLPQPFEALREIVRILKPGGIVALTTINHRCLNETLLGAGWRYYQPPDHVCSFTPQILKAMLGDLGVSVISISHHYMFEVLADAHREVWRKSDKSTPGALLANKARKVMYSALAQGMGLVLNAFKSGDLVTVYARKREQR
jgi:2-polyprenyl-3-methyl-5-hydroxy-6-metoxy-1,4-benzoquinol methylase